MSDESRAVRWCCWRGWRGWRGGFFLSELVVNLLRPHAALHPSVWFKGGSSRTRPWGSERRAALVILGFYLVCAGADSPRSALSLGVPVSAAAVASSPLCREIWCGREIRAANTAGPHITARHPSSQAAAGSVAKPPPGNYPVSF